MSLKRVLLTGAFATAFLFAGAKSAEAHPDRNCGNRIRSEQSKLDRDIRKHGWNSRQAQQRRTKIHRLRQQCGGDFWGLWRGDRDRDGRWDRDRDRDRDRRGDDRRWRDNDRRNDRRDDRDRRYWRWDGRRWHRR